MILKIDALSVLREKVANCNACFTDRQGCRHHEDAVGGYGEGRIVLIGINPQGSNKDPVYKAIEALLWHERNLLGNRILDLFVAERKLRAGAKATAGLGYQLQRAVEEIFPDASGLHAVPFDQHKGLRTWFPCVAERLDCTPEELRDHVTIVESIKHTTANEQELREQGDLLEKCRPWLEQQLAHLKPRGVVFTGNRGIKLARELGVLDVEAQANIGKLHGEGRKWEVGAGTPEEQTVEVLFCYAFSQQTGRYWKSNPSSEQVRRWFRERLRS